MKIPPYLQKNSTAGIVCPSGYLPKENTDYAVEVLQRWGFNVRIGKTVGNAYNYFSGTDDERLEDLQQMLDDENINAILMGRGGYGLSRIIDKIDFTNFIKKPKWICGFSDVVILQNHIQAQFDIACLHSPMCSALQPATEFAPHLLSLKKALFGADLLYNIPVSPFNKTGIADGIMTGGNLAILAHLTGSVSEVDTKDKILFIEEIGEQLYNTDRMLLNLKRAGKLSQLKALLVGSFSNMQDTTRPFGQTVEKIILDKVKEYNYPVCFNFPCGHQEINYTLCLGMSYKISVKENESTLELLR